MDSVRRQQTGKDRVGPPSLLIDTCSYIVETEYLQDIQYVLASRPGEVRSLQHTVQQMESIGLLELLRDGDAQRGITRAEGVSHFGSLSYICIRA